MAFGDFKETNETKEASDNKEASTENSEKRRNQILDVPEDYDDDFDSKLDANDKKENSDTPEKNKDSEGSEKQGLFDRIKSFFSKDKPDESNENKESDTEKNNETEKSRSESFRDSLKVDQSPEEIKKYNEEHGYSSEATERPKGGTERERSTENTDPRWADSVDDSTDDPEDN